MKLWMKAKIASIHNKIDITDENKTPVYHVQSKVLSIHNVTYLKRANGEEVATITCKVVSLHETHLIEMRSGQTVELRSELFHATKDVLDIEALGWQLVGDLVQHNYRLIDVDDEGRLLARTHRKWLSLHNTYEVEIMEEESADLIVAVLVALDKIVCDREQVIRGSSAGSTAQGSSSQG